MIYSLQVGIKALKKDKIVRAILSKRSNTKGGVYFEVSALRSINSVNSGADTAFVLVLSAFLEGLGSYYSPCPQGMSTIKVPTI